ncbi:MAG: hypothetical protein V7784_14285 [Oceanospirillaceae bacterium]
MSTGVIFGAQSSIQRELSTALDKRIVLFAGLSGVGKSLYIQQFAKMAAQQGRIVHLLQWDVTREAFQTEEILQKYPEIEGVTHSMIRKAVGLWARKGIAQWHQKYSDEKHILIGELPLIGNRLIEIVQRIDDAVEPFLASDQVQFFIPVPSQSVRQYIVNCRAQSIANPSHEREALDAPPSVVDSMWQQSKTLALSLGIKAEGDSPDYDPHLYLGAYQHLLQHRHTNALLIDEVLPTQDSVYELEAIASEINADAAQVQQIFAQLEARYSLEEVETMTDNWYQV